MAGLYLHKKSGAKVNINSLSSGEKAFIILLADLARRLQMMRPDTPAADIPGVVMIDEIELNLHPAWQSKILSILGRVFPNCQFIVTTHSPQVISSVGNECVRVLSLTDDGSLAAPEPLSTKGRSSNYLLEGVFGATERSPDVDLLFDEFNGAVDDRDFSRARELLEKIREGVDGEPPELLVLKTRLQRISGAP
jgi:hypothetical protein